MAQLVNYYNQNKMCCNFLMQMEKPNNENNKQIRIKSILVPKALEQ